MDGPDAQSDMDRVRDGLRLFNEGYFFEAHEVLEDVWHRERGEPRLFLQGLIQLCAAYHHFQNGNYIGAVELLQRGADKMRGYPARYLGLAASDLVAHADADRERIRQLQLNEGTQAMFEFPRIAYDSP